MLDMEMSNDMEYSNYYLGDNSTGEWWNDTDSWEDSQSWSDTWFEFALGSDDYLFHPGDEMMMENATEQIHILDICGYLILVLIY